MKPDFTRYFLTMLRWMHNLVSVIMLIVCVLVLKEGLLWWLNILVVVVLFTLWLSTAMLRKEATRAQKEADKAEAELAASRHAG